MTAAQAKTAERHDADGSKRFRTVIPASPDMPNVWITHHVHLLATLRTAGAIGGLMHP
ncbi:MAG: hypothetical protein V4673_17445 [Pseudomonadota bacterium]